MHLLHHGDSESLRSRNSSYSNSDSGSSNQSRQSHSTQGTQYTGPSSRPPFVHYETCEGRLEGSRLEYCHQIEDPRSSVETYASTVPSEIDDDEESLSDGPRPLPRPDVYQSRAIPSTPSDFAELFPSERLLSIRHDDSTPDGNMNLRIDTVYENSHYSPIDVTLFHLRMHDLKSRQFSLRRYCRESGREVCHSMRKCQKSSAERRMEIQRSLSNAFASLCTIAEHKASAPSAGLKRSDSGYESLQSHKSIEPNQQAVTPTGLLSRRHMPIPTKTIKLEFSNYAQVEVKRRGAKSSKRYEFEYWGVHYVWKRITDRIGSSKEVSFCLFRNNEDCSLARIKPTLMSGVQQREELSKGGWVPPCTMGITDEEILENHNEITDVVVAAGLIALVDDCIKRRFHTRPVRGIVVPIPKFRLDMEYMSTAKRLGEEQARRPSTRGSTASRRPTPLRKGSCDV
ncbi:hypothetical protein E4T49_05270 [Aureobasidium sp. EXF-10728]|nr:hypothetical protein E4T49_05270 [Aureobasidium sp. EXF-10728]